MDRKFSGGSDLGFDTVEETNAGDDVGEEAGAVEEPPAFGGGLHELEDHRQAGDAGAVAFGLAMPQSHRGERAFDGVGRPQVQPVLRREVIEGQQLVSIFLKHSVALGYLARKFPRRCRRLGRLRAGRRHPDFMQFLFGCRLQAFGQLIQHIGRLVHPAALFAGRRTDLLQRLPEPERPVADGQFGVSFRPRRCTSTSNACHDCSLSR